MNNIKTKIDGNKLIIEVDLTKKGAASKSGKSVVIATTSGNVDAGKDGIKFGLNVYKPNG